MIFEISCSIFKKNIFFFNFHFLKTVIFGYFWFLAKTPPNYKSCSKNCQNHQFALLTFTFHLKKNHFSTLTFFLGPLTWNRPLVKWFRFGWQDWWGHSGISLICDIPQCNVLKGNVYICTPHRFSELSCALHSKWNSITRHYLPVNLWTNLAFLNLLTCEVSNKDTKTGKNEKKKKEEEKFICDVSGVRCHMSGVKYHKSCVTCQVSLVTCH